MRDITLGDTFYHDFTTRQFSDGVPTTLAGSPVLSVLEENNATPITAGVSVSVDRATVDGLNEATIVATGGNGYEAGKSYSIYISTGTVGGVSVVGEVVGQFTVGASAAFARIGAAGASLTDLGGMSTGMKSEVESEANDALVVQKLDHLVAQADGDDPVNGSIMAHLASASEDWSTFVPSTDSLQAVRDRGDAEWATATGFSTHNAAAVWSVATRVLTANTNLNDPTAATIADAVHNEALSDHQTQGTAGAALTMAAYAGPRGPGVYIDDGAANTGTTLGDDGTVENPVSTIAAATTIASNLGVQTLYLINDTVITLVQAYEGYTFIGLGLSNKITLGSQDVDNSEFCNLILTGTQGGTGQIYAHHCSLTALVSAELIAFHCWLTGNNTLRAATTHIFKDCCSAVAGQATPDLTFPGSGTTEVNFRNYSGGLTVKSATANDTMSFDADGQIVIDASCTSLTISVRGNCQITDSGTTTSLTQEAAINRTNINTEVDNSMVTYGLDHLVSASVSDTDVADNSIIAEMVDAGSTSDYTNYSKTEDSLRAISEKVSSIGSASGGGFNFAAVGSDALTDTINDAEAAVDKSTSPATVGIPVTGHAFLAGHEVTIGGTVNYNGSFVIDSVSTDEVVIVSAFSAETFSGTDTIISSIKTDSIEGVETTNTFSSTVSEDGVYHVIDDDGGNNFTISYRVEVGGGRRATEAVFQGFLNGSNDNAFIQAYDFVGSAWETRALLTGQNGSVNQAITIPLLARNTGTSALDLGVVFLRITDDTGRGSSNPTLNVDSLLVEAVGIGQTAGYQNGQLWLDTNSGTAGAEAFVNGVSDKPCLTLADLKALSASVGLSDFHIINGSVVTLAESTTNESYFGDNWELALGGQDVDGAYFQGARVTGVGVSATEVHYEGGNIGTMSVQIGHFDFCSFDGTVTHTLAGDYEYHNCYSNIAGAGAPTFTKTAGQAITAEWRNWMDSITVSGLESGDTITINGRLGTVTLNGADATVEIRGSYKSIVNNLTGAPTVNIDGAWKGADIADTLLDTAEIGTAGAGLTNINLPNQTMDIVGDITGDLSGSVGSVTGAVGSVAGNVDGSVGSVTGAVGSVTGAVGSVAGNVDGNVTGSVGSLAAQAKTDVQAEVDTSLTSYDGPTNAEMEARTLAAGPLAQLSQNLDDCFTGTASGTPTTTTMVSDIGVTVDDQYNARIITFDDDTTTAAVRGQSTDITGCTAASNTLAFTALTTAPVSGDTFVIT